MGADKKEIPFESGMTVSSAFNSANVEVPADATVTVNGKQVDIEQQLEDGAQIVITPNVSNG